MALLAGVAATTVSLSLRAPTLTRVQAAVDATGYLPNLVASVLASGRTQVVPAVVPIITRAGASRWLARRAARRRTAARRRGVKGGASIPDE